MEKTRVLRVLVLLTSLRVAFVGAEEGTCCDWTENAEWPLEASQCPANLDGANATYCCGLCYAPHHCPFEETWLDQECPADDQHECPDEEQLAATSGSASKGGFWDSYFVLILPAAFVIFFICTWLCLKNEQEASGSFRGSVSSFVRSQLQSRYPPPRYGACSAAATLDSATNPVLPQDLPCPSAETNVAFHQETSEMPEEEEEVSLSPPMALQEEPGSGDAPEPGSGDAPEPGSGDAPEPGSGDAPEPGSGDAPEPGSGDAPEPGSGDAPEPGSGDAPEPGSGDAPEPGSGDAPEPGSGDAPEPGSGDAPEPSLPTE